ncbi:MAG: hypothetical protein IJ864_06355 [Alphaproteobacteria bacterium]|nr:hypothetical protein [Alphaproteobacteria bacterium]
MKKKLHNVVYPLILLSAVLFFVAVLLHYQGIAAAISLSVALVMMFLSLIEAIYFRHSLFTYAFRLCGLLIVGAALSFNMGVSALAKVCSFGMMLCLIIVVGYVVYFLTVYNVRDAENHAITDD